MTRSVKALVLVAPLWACGGNFGDPPDEEPDARPRSLDDAGLISIDAAPVIVPARCDDGAVRISDPISGNCYARFDEEVTWPVASARCQAAGAHLVSIASAEEDALVEMVAPQTATLPAEFDVWTGANDLATEMTWAWEVTGEPFAFTNWRTPEPNNNNPMDPMGEDCAVFEGDSNSWDDRSCTLGLLKYVCEREATLE